MKQNPLFTNKESKALDALTIKELGFREETLMGMAALSVFHANEDLWKTAESIWILSGTGGNGGDGYALAHILHQEGYKVRSFSTAPNKSEAGKFYESLVSKTLGAIGTIEDFYKEWEEAKEDSVLLVDALLGTGFQNELSNELAELIETINDSDVFFYRLSLDSPSGWNPYDIGKSKVPNTFVYADSIEELGTRKWENVGFIYEKDSIIPRYFESIGFPIRTHLSHVTFSNRYYLEADPESAIQTLKRKNKDHKYSAGSALFYGGSDGMEGAILLSEQAFSRLGGGISKIFSPSLKISSFVLKEDLSKMTKTSSLAETLEDPFLKKTKTVVVGPGLTQYPNDLSGWTVPEDLRLVLDAGAIPTKGSPLPKGNQILLTPHVGELNRMTGKTHNSVQSAYDTLVEYCSQNNVYVLLKSFVSLLVCPDGSSYVWESPNPKLATMGTGDLLSGILARYLSLDLTIPESVQLALSLLDHSKQLEEPYPSAHQILKSLVELL
ncbi:bifunctional ADP-dependent NAD(P)H-hydrate dehydratase/NAD(P)H-hydrate epimerase [Leptospira meyeri]|uniref:bifunctional ADP-dependent NAD(P)H-hydrate dehydratase/NAD(P)H-hydrate epimerase n=1 Tax=Leptospira meyeri TaxID=29508 RepID=UPI000C2A2F9C|nr:bifunctional ADP-dependent NAD(P)H-hydrate dehydratase/NAD(P)H-hydrate epimerase [Leptospira meyeri]PJZ82669.1 bifunctional ADP-dependent (S)-NAD(P)H-hydrate dehydratase/NAD(P)H-hydrate epimerase [Leptospira meyeri]PJZ98092.1 bifunctional ADP-dependent (S)-NAD(P)H-hydrate dehydratase/NAD(P)H-hydrate epimerase [Leptospira meyeri]TGL14232.1 bifunctional ADP-dependent NAD(P)H-hydrate dehydratase/NAD(P)H-hydrate epimerase [Leptospira meyeri]